CIFLGTTPKSGICPSSYTSGVVIPDSPLSTKRVQRPATMGVATPSSRSRHEVETPFYVSCKLLPLCVDPVLEAGNSLKHETKTLLPPLNDAPDAQAETFVKPVYSLSK
ncbi:MAG: hypothetical protein ACREJ4_13160, partial [Candidatus Methylomirabilaceae bacterium]